MHSFSSARHAGEYVSAFSISSMNLSGCAPRYANRLRISAPFTGHACISLSSGNSSAMARASVALPMASGPYISTQLGFVPRMNAITCSLSVCRAFSWQLSCTAHSFCAASSSHARCPSVRHSSVLLLSSTPVPDDANRLKRSCAALFQLSLSVRLMYISSSTSSAAYSPRMPFSP